MGKKYAQHAVRGYRLFGLDSAACIVELPQLFDQIKQQLIKQKRLNIREC